MTLDPSSTLVALPSAEERPYFYIGIYGAIALSGGLVSIFAAMTQYAGALKASRSMFKLLLRNIVRATIRWYDVTPQGRILNRFSRVWSALDRRRFAIGLTRWDLRTLKLSTRRLVKRCRLFADLWPLWCSRCLRSCESLVTPVMNVALRCS